MTVVRPDGETVAEIDAGTVVAVVPPSPRLELVAALQARGLPHTLAGDALAPRTATDAFREGEQAALAL